MNLAGNGGLSQPQHPSLDNLRLNRSNGGSRSHPQLPTDTSASHTGTQQNRVRFNEEVDHDEVAMLWETIKGIIASLLAIACSFGLITILVVLYFIVRPISQPMARRLAAQIGAASFIDAMALLLPNYKIYLTGDSDIPSPVGTSILVTNHLMDGDWLPMLMLSRCAGLRGSLKVFLRNELLQLHKYSNNSSPTGGNRNFSLSNQPGEATASSLAAPSMNNSVSFAGRFTSQPSPSSSTINSSTQPLSTDLALIAKFLHTFLEFPLLSGDDYISDRESLFQLLRSFAAKHGASVPVHLLLFPECWSVHNGADRKSVLAKSNEFAKREGRPQLKHLLLPRTTGFNASLDSLRESSPVVYDVTMAYRGYDGSLPPKFELSLVSIWTMIRKRFPREIYIRIKRYSMEEVLQDASWLDKKWAEKDRLLNHFSRHQAFPPDGRGFCRHRVFETRSYSIESSIASLGRLMLVPMTVPVILLITFPLLCVMFWVWVAHVVVRFFLPDPGASPSSRDGSATPGEGMDQGQTPRCDSATSTPFFPATPFASPSVSSWRDMLTGNPGN